MAEKIVLTDDLNENESEGVEKIFFSVEGKNYRIDLGTENRKKFFKALAPFIDAAKPVGGSVRASNSGADASARQAAKDRLAALRAWAAENDLHVPARGRIPATIESAFEEANPQYRK